MRRAGLATLVCATLLARRAEADDDPAEVRVLGDRADAISKYPGSGVVITPREIEREAPLDASEILRRVPGIQARQDLAAGQRLDIGVRGLESGRSRRVLVLEDGIPIGLNPYAEPDLYYATPVERIRAAEVVKGSGSILFGPQTLGGVVNFVTLAPPDRLQLTVDAEGGGYGYARSFARYGDSLGPARYVTQLSYRRGDGYRGEAFDSVDAFAKIALETSPRGRAVLKIGVHDDDADSGAVGLTREMFAADPERKTLTPNDHLHLRRYEASIIHEQELAPRVALKTLAYAYVTDRIWRRQNYLRVPDPSEHYERLAGDPSLPGGALYFQQSNAVLDRQYEVAGVEPRVTHRIATGPVLHTLDYGARLLVEGARYQQRTGQTPRSYAGTLDAEEKHRTLAVAAYLQDRIAFRDDLLVTPGVRVERAAFHRDIGRQTGPTGAQDADLASDSSAGAIIPGIAMTYGGRRAHVFGGLHLGWAPPRVGASVSPNGTSADLGGEESINYELGTRVRPSPWLRFDSTAFMSNFRNQIVLVPGAAVAGAVAAEGPTRHLGIEASTTVEIGRAFGVKSQTIDASARYNLARATFVDGPTDGNILPYAPLQTFSANIDVEDRSGLGGQIAYAFVGPQFTDAANTVAADASGRVGLISEWHIVDVTAHYRHKRSGLSAQLTIKNALDDKYIVARRPEGIFAAGFRQVILGARWDYERAP